jgi:ribosomal protein S18 acetylase RimI-like enzyme
MNLWRKMTTDHEPPVALTRRATSHDERAVLAVDAKASAGDRERQEVLRQAIRTGQCIVYERDTHVVGVLVVKPRHFYGRDFIDLLFVSSDARRQGVGRALIRAAVESASTPRMFTSTNKSNMAMQALLRSEGWSPSGELVGLDEGDPELVYYRSRGGHSF